MNIKRLLSSPTAWLLVYIAITSVIGLSTFQNYGASWDEPGIYSFAKETANSYASFLQPVEYLDPRSNWDLKYYGPFYFTLTHLLVEGIVTIGVQIPQSDLWHLIYFLTFQVGVGVFYLLSRRWVTDWAALGTTVLFASQPLLWGHAFINPKDTPFMVFFLVSFYVGLVMVDRLTDALPLPAPRANFIALFRQGKDEWRGVALKVQQRAKIQAGFFVGLAFLILVANPFWQSLLSGFIRTVYENADHHFIGALFKLVAQSAVDVPVENYIHKISVWLVWSEMLATLILVGLAGKLILRRIPTTSAALGQWFFFPFRVLLISLRNPIVLFSGILLGLTSSVRLLGPLVGFLMAILLIYRLRMRAWSPLLVYGGVALLSMFVTWPFLWDQPIKHFITSLNIMSNFPMDSIVLFAGRYYPASQLPWLYLPGLLSIQFTEPAILFFSCSLIIVFLKYRSFCKADLLLLVIGWILLPFSLLIIGQRTLYDNFRHILFLIPPLFIIAGFTIDALFNYIRPGLFRIITIIIIGLFGWTAMFQIHPYEYVYYNRFVGGPVGATHRYYLDYWGTSFREVAGFLNVTAPANTKIIFCGPPNILELYLRPDLSLQEDCSGATRQDDYSIVVFSTRDMINLFPNARVIFTAQRAGAVFAVVKSLP